MNNELFKKKVDNLIGKASFIEQALKISSETESNEGAKKYSTTGDEFVDNFAAASYFKNPRSYEEVANDMSVLWNKDPRLCVKFAIYLRLITRKSKLITGEELSTQKGTGLRNEGIMRMFWLAINQSSTFKVNFPLFISAGSWKDVIKMLSLDLQYHEWKNRKLDWNFMYDIILAGLNSSETTNLVRKYLPTIRTNNKCTTLESQANTLIGRWLAKRFNPDLDKEAAYKAYRKIKSEGIAHEWQQFISKQLYDEINFNHIAGKALLLLVGSKFLENHNLISKYTEWIQNKPVAKFTGFVHELFAPFDNNLQHIEDYREYTINAQFNQLIQNADYKTSLIVVRDTSASMTAKAIGCNVTSNCIAKSMALYFSESLKGKFSNTFLEFSNTCKLHKWKGETPIDKYINDKCEAFADTNFQSVIDLFIKLKDKGVKEEDFPSGILCLSDGEFSRTESNTTTNFELALKRLKEAGFSDNYVNNFQIILWDIPNCYYLYSDVKFESYEDTKNFFYISGYDPSIITFLVKGDKPNPPKNAKELFLNAMDQELLNRVQIIKMNRVTLK